MSAQKTMAYFVYFSTGRPNPQRRALGDLGQEVPECGYPLSSKGRIEIFWIKDIVDPVS